MEWELSKENVQPLRKGRKVEVLNEILHTKEECPARSKIFDSQRRAMIEAIDSYEGDDPLHPWLQCIRWVKDAYPTGGYQSELLPVAEACTRTFQNDERYKSDIRYLRVWVLYADLCKEPREIYQFLEVHSIGQNHALFYEAYATYMEICKNHSKANEIYELGLHRGAQPTTRLHSMYQSFLKRMMQRNERKLQEDQEDPYEPEKLRHFGDTRISHNRTSARNLSSSQDQQRQKVQQPQVQRSGIAVFVDDEFQSGTNLSSVPQPANTLAPATATWKNLGTLAEVRKENDQLPAKWTETRVPRMGKVPKLVEAHPPIDVYVDDECEQAQARLKAKNMSAAPASLRLRIDAVSDLRRNHEALQKNPLRHFTEDDKPSTASLLRREPYGEAQEQSSEEPDSGDASTIGYTAAPHMIGSEIYKVREGGHECSFEEVRLQASKMPHQTLQKRSVSSPRNSAEKAELIEKSLSMFQKQSVKQKSRGHSPLSHQTKMESLKSERSTPKASLYVRDPEISTHKGHRGSFHGSSSAESFAYLMPPQSNRSSPSRASSVSSMDEPPPFACSMPTSLNSAASIGEETVAIKKYAEQLITLGSDPDARTTDVVGHQGLLDQTINTKECLQDILSMFNRPLSCEKPQRKSKANISTRSAALSDDGFQVFMDDNLDAPRPHKSGIKKSGGFEICQDEENGKVPSQATGKNRFDVFVDEAVAPPPRKSKLQNSKAFEIFQNQDIVSREPRKESFEVFSDEQVDAQPGRNRVARQPARKPPATARGSFDVLVDDDLNVQSKVSSDLSRASGGPSSRTAKGGFQVYVDEDLESLEGSPKSTTELESFSIYKVMPPPKNVDRRTTKSKPSVKPQESGFSIFVDDDLPSQSLRKTKQPSITRR